MRNFEKPCNRSYIFSSTSPARLAQTSQISSVTASLHRPPRRLKRRARRSGGASRMQHPHAIKTPGAARLNSPSPQTYGRCLVRACGDGCETANGHGRPSAAVKEKHQDQSPRYWRSKTAFEIGQDASAGVHAVREGRITQTQA